MTDQESAVEQSEEEIDPLTLFPDQWQVPVQGLTFLGQLTENVAFCGHTFGLRTLKPQHRMAIAQVLQPYRNTIYEVDIFQWLHVGLALTHVDGDYNFCPPIGRDPSLEDLARARLHYVSNETDGWHTPTLDFLYLRYQLLEATATKGTAELQNLLLRGQPPTSSPWREALISPASSPDETSSDTPPSVTSS